MMTVERARHILATYQLPLTPSQLKEYKEALAFLASVNLGAR
jgi:hypothetical protein